MVYNKFFAIVRLGMGGDTMPTDRELTIDADEWSLIYKMAHEHGVLGIAFDGMQKLSKDNYPPRPLLMQWFAMTEQIRRRNQQLNANCAKLTSMLESVGVDACVLKGQGMAVLYPQPDLRSPGDIDVWVKLHDRPTEKVDKSLRDIIDRIKSLNKGRIGKAVYHHVEWMLGGTSVEVHYRPQYLNNMCANRRFQHWCNEQWLGRVRVDDDRHEYYVPSVEFNVVYLLVHLYHHLLFEGMSMKQVCDYYMLLKAKHTELLDCKQDVVHTIRRLGLRGFAAGVMWMLGEMFNLSPDEMIVSPDEREGRFILNELVSDKTKAPEFAEESTLARFVRLTRYRTRFLRRYTNEILWDIPFRFYNWWWRKGKC